MKNNEDTSAEPLAVRCADLTKTFVQGSARVEALRGVSLDVRSGEFVAVMGASGSGKSTLLHLLAGLMKPDGGEIEIEEKRLDRMTDRVLTVFRRRRIGLVFQNCNLIPHLTAAENIMLPIAADRRRDRMDSPRFEALFDQLGLTREQLAQRPDTLSGGQQQRVALARALALEQAIVLADEPTGNLDSISSQRICEILDSLCRQQGRTIILVTHEPAVAVWSSRLIVLADGRVLADEPTDRFADAHALADRYQEIVESAAEASKEVRP